MKKNKKVEGSFAIALSAGRNIIQAFGLLWAYVPICDEIPTLAAHGLEEQRNFEELLIESVARVHFP